MKKRVLVFLLVLCMSVGFAGTLFAKGQTEEEESEAVWKIGVSNNYIANDWRQQIMKSIEYVAEQESYKDKVDLTIVNCENTAEDQIASIDALVLEGMDAILINCNSATALNDAIKRADDAGVVVVAFDHIAMTPHAYKIEFDHYGLSAMSAEFICKKLNYKGKVVADRGLAGSQGAGPLYDGAVDTFNKYEGIEIVHEFNGNFAEGDTLAGMNASIATNPVIDGVYSQAHVIPIWKAMREAGRPMPVVGGWLHGNQALLEIAKNPELEAVVVNGSPGIISMALKVALDTLEGTKQWDKENIIYHKLPIYSNDPDIDVPLPKGGLPIEKVEIGVNCWEDVHPKLIIPYIDPVVGVEIPYPFDVIMGYK
jgi:ribose transport system substrate-binding protein